MVTMQVRDDDQVGPARLCVRRRTAPPAQMGQMIAEDRIGKNPYAVLGDRCAGVSPPGDPGGIGQSRSE
jgi:hypothetical protein